jgi:hypothetical protein
MSFVELLKNDQAKTESDQPQKLVTESIEKIEKIDEAKKPEEILRGAGYKIKLVTPTSFGTQIDFAKAYDPKDVQNILKGFTTKIKGKSVFIVD